MACWPGYRYSRLAGENRREARLEGARLAEALLGEARREVRLADAPLAEARLEEARPGEAG